MFIGTFIGAFVFPLIVLISLKKTLQIYQIRVGGLTRFTEVTIHSLSLDHPESVSQR